VKIAEIYLDIYEKAYTPEEKKQHRAELRALLHIDNETVDKAIRLADELRRVLEKKRR